MTFIFMMPTWLKKTYFFNKSSGLFPADATQDCNKAFDCTHVRVWFATVSKLVSDIKKTKEVTSQDQTEIYTAQAAAYPV